MLLNSMGFFCVSEVPWVRPSQPCSENIQSKYMPQQLCKDGMDFILLGFQL